MTPASVGLSRYYEYVLKGIEQVSIIKPTKKQLDDIEKSIKKEKYIDDIMDSKELEAILDKLSIKRTYH